MIYPFDAAHAQAVLRAHFNYAGALKSARAKLAARAHGLVRYDRFLAHYDSDVERACQRRAMFRKRGYFMRNPA